MKEFRDLVLCDYKSDKIWIIVRASLVQGALELAGHDLGDNVKNFWGDDDYEYWYRLDAKETKRLLKLIHGIWSPLETIKREFSGPDGCRKLRELCDKNGIRYEFYSYV